MWIWPNFEYLCQLSVVFHLKSLKKCREKNIGFEAFVCGATISTTIAEHAEFYNVCQLVNFIIVKKWWTQGYLILVALRQHISPQELNLVIQLLNHIAWNLRYLILVALRQHISPQELNLVIQLLNHIAWNLRYLILVALRQHISPQELNLVIQLLNHIAWNLRYLILVALRQHISGTRTKFINTIIKPHRL